MSVSTSRLNYEIVLLFWIRNEFQGISGEGFRQARLICVESHKPQHKPVGSLGSTLENRRKSLNACMVGSVHDSGGQ